MYIPHRNELRTFNIHLKKIKVNVQEAGSATGVSSLQGRFQKVGTSWWPVHKVPLAGGGGKAPLLVRRALDRCTGSCTNKLLKWDINKKINGERKSSDIWIIHFLLEANLAERGGSGRRLCHENALPIKLEGEQPCCPRSCMWHWLLESRGY